MGNVCGGDDAARLADEVGAPGFDQPPELGYWKIRGLASPARMMFAYKGQKFVDQTWEQGSKEEGYAVNMWFDVKPSYAMEYGNLPYLIDGKLKITESQAIYRYICRKLGIGSTNIQGQAYENCAGDVIQSWRNDAVGLFYSGDAYDGKVGDYTTKTVPKYLTLFNQALERPDPITSGGAAGGGEPRQFIAGDQVCYADFHLIELLYQHKQLMDDGMLDKYPMLDKYYKRFMKLDNIEKYFEDAKSVPINNKVAAWGGDGSRLGPFSKESAI